MHIITTHKNTDFDALASVIAGTLLYPGAVGVIPKAVNTNVAKFLSTHKTAFNIVLPNEIDHDKVKRLTVVDTDQWRRLDRLQELIKSVAVVRKARKPTRPSKSSQTKRLDRKTRHGKTKQLRGRVSEQ